jgi:AraC family transcriptional regulator, regulatory protein of adaptative response / methylated-DNA-[protein]-cysteine methyltransferase
MSHYKVISNAIGYMNAHSGSEVSLDDLAAHLHMSKSHVQKVFTEWAGISPKQFQRFLSLQYAKALLKEQNPVLQTSFMSGLSSAGRLHDLFVDIEAVTPGEFKHGGEGLILTYSVHESYFGIYLVASTTKGVCNVLFIEARDNARHALELRWPKAVLVEKISEEFHTPVVEFFRHQNPTRRIKLHLNGTNFQLQVWKALLSIPEGKLSSYGMLAKSIDPKAGSLVARATGTAIGDNPVGYIIPCHRVIKSTGHLSGYRWGVTRKQAILCYESAHSNK